MVRTAGFVDFAVCLSISVSITIPAALKFEAATVRIVRDVSRAPCITGMGSRLWGNDEARAPSTVVKAAFSATVSRDFHHNNCSV